MIERKMILAAGVLLVALAVPLLGHTAPESNCMGHRSVAGWSTATVRCTLATAGDGLNIRATIAAAGTYTSFMFPFPSIVHASVSIETLDGTTELSCSHTDLVAAQCGKQMRVSVPVGTRLTCVVNGWTNMTVGTARLAYACMSR